MAILNEYDPTFIRRSDTLLIGSRDDELSNIEFKKATALNNLAKYQQNKNIKINSCILNHINLMTGATDKVILYYDSVGGHSYLAQLFECGGIYVCQKLQSITIPRNMLELEIFRLLLKHMFIWKAHMINLGNNIIQFRLADVSGTTSPPCSPSPNVQAAKVYLSPSNANKRTRSTFEEDRE
ncbi:hypothetical protein BCV72DRAFT_330987 [Rhizopus microsporus var. microsporus]|uniref:Uncharacterized protein n=1 Tax=Rhizopus microsporus var. microsporus TaxID=86635 RepID=A0A1X0R0B1_RHIZD|nr:hypothetical protein BCV72DRAFT_330987 [Rhizopus microsporus var. microsporus]